MLAEAQAAGAIPLAVHPALAFTGTSLDLVRLRESWCAVTAAAPVLPIALALVVELGAEPVVVAESDREAYARAIDAATTFPAAAVQGAIDSLRGLGIESPGRLLGSLVRSSVENALQRAAGDD